MARNEERKGVLPQIIVAVVVALLVGGSAPWWWHIVFPEKHDGTQTVGGQIQVQCTANPPSILAGGPAEIRVLAFTQPSSPVSSANVRIEAGGGWFSASGTTTVVGQTAPDGVFMTQWLSPNPAARAYGMNVLVTKNGFAEGRGECNIRIQ